MSNPLSGCRSKSEVPYIMVQNYMTLPEDISNDVPFGWRIKGYLEELWVQAQYITGAEGEPPRMPGNGTMCWLPVVSGPFPFGTF